MREPMISVIMPVYNGEKYLPEAIESILNQTYKNFEFIIINDGSTDRTEEIILSYKDDRIIYVKNEKNLQIVESLNKGINLAKGKYIARMDADDISLPKRLEKQIEFMEKNTHVGVCGTWMKTFGEKNEVWKMPISHDEIVVSMLFNSCIMHPTAVIRTKVLKENNLYYDQKYNKVEDYELWTRLVKYTQFANIPEILLKYRIFENDSSRKSYKEQQKKLSNLVRQNYLKSLGIDFTEKELVV
ncbi:MAG TPA: glycosyltransferase family 2 protein, partial [Defluviitoga tunisiensis]|nr:glycosyltransferase family 2 protein [Defluviitoga tunisiensis]